MDLATFLTALTLGALEGLTEFLPISSTGHLIIAGDLLGFTGAKADTFKIVIQLGAILAICWNFRKKIEDVVFGLPHSAQARRFAINILVAFIPAMILGATLHGFIKAHLFHSLNVAIALILGGIVILFIERKLYRPRIENVDDMNWKDALKVGLAQSAALIPGVSRSGATIMGGLVFGLSRKAATEFSFFLAIPTMFAATVYDLYKSRDLLRLEDVATFGTGFIAAFIAALIAVKVLLHYVATHDFRIFAWYRIVFGAIVLLYYW
mgnify:CR=1 FL=1